MEAATDAVGPQAARLGQIQKALSLPCKSGKTMRQIATAPKASKHAALPAWYKSLGPASSMPCRRWNRGAR